MEKFIVGVVVGILLVPLVGHLYMLSGRAPVAASASPLPLERLFAKTALHATLRRDAPKTAPLQPAPDNLLSGLMVYRQNCVFCHGLPNKPESNAARGMFPHPPQLFEPRDMVTTIRWVSLSGRCKTESGSAGCLDFTPPSPKTRCGR